MVRKVLSGSAVALALLLLPHQSGLAQSRHSLPLVISASNPLQEGFVRITNHSDRAGTVEIHAIDDFGQRFGPITIDLAAKASVHFNSNDLESGNAAKGLSGGVGDGEGDWRLELETSLHIEPLGYIRTADGFVTSMHDLVVDGGATGYHVPIFNPGSNRSQVSRLRLINDSDAEAAVTIEGLDDRGTPGDEKVRVNLPAGTARTISAQDLELGASGLVGRLGDGAGKWHLFVSADRPLQLMNLLKSPTGHLTNLSRSTIPPLVACDPTVASVDIPDFGLRTAIEQALRKASGDPISGADLASLTELNAQNQGIRNLTGLECASGLTTLNLADNQISDLSELSGLSKLAWLGLWNNSLPDLSPLSGLWSLTWLNLWGSQVSDLSPLSGLTSLTFLELGNNRITDVSPLSGLTALTSLDIDKNSISDVSPLSSLTALTDLELQSNRISDLSGLSGLTSLTKLALWGNPLGDLSPLSGLRSLTWLNLWGSQVSDLSALSGLASLTFLELGNNRITDVSPLSGLTALTSLDIDVNMVSDVSPLSGLTALAELELAENRISDIGPLVSNPGLGQGDVLTLTDNPLSSDSLNTHIPALQARGVSVSY